MKCDCQAIAYHDGTNSDLQSPIVKPTI